MNMENVITQRLMNLQTIYPHNSKFSPNTDDIQPSDAMIKLLQDCSHIINETQADFQWAAYMDHKLFEDANQPDKQFLNEYRKIKPDDVHPGDIVIYIDPLCESPILTNLLVAMDTYHELSSMPGCTPREFDFPDEPEHPHGCQCSFVFDNLISWYCLSGGVCLYNTASDACIYEVWSRYPN